MTHYKKFAVLISGNGSNLQALIDASSADDYPGRISVVISNVEDAYGLSRAKDSDIPHHFVDHVGAPREEFENEMITILERYDTEWVCLAGFMRVLTPKFIDRYRGKILNVHPSLLPAHPGVNAHEDVIRSGDRVSGATVHYVDEKVDNGRICLQKACLVYPDDTVDTLRERVHKIEHEIYPKALKFILWKAIRQEKRREHESWNSDGQQV